MSGLEDRYRRALRWYPRRWRALHGDALLGILLDQADHEGQAHMSNAERRNLIRHGLARRVTPVLLALLIVLGVLAALQIGSMLTAHVGLDSQLLFSPPPLHPVPVGTGWVPLFVISFSGSTLYLTSVGVLAAAAVSSTLLIRRLRRA